MKLTKKLFLLIIFLIFANPNSAQKIELSKRNIYKVFKNTIVQNKKNFISIPSNAWYTNNTNNNYYKSDTITFTNAQSYNRSFCNVINWTFYKKDKFVRTFGNYCNEPPTEKVSNKSDFFDIKIIKQNSDLILELYNDRKIIETFKVISLESSQTLSYKNVKKITLTLKRL